jgi:hypothetical protein
MAAESLSARFIDGSTAARVRARRLMRERLADSARSPSAASWVTSHFRNKLTLALLSNYNNRQGAG